MPIKNPCYTVIPVSLRYSVTYKLDVNKKVYRTRLMEDLLKFKFHIDLRLNNNGENNKIHNKICKDGYETRK